MATRTITDPDLGTLDIPTTGEIVVGMVPNGRQVRLTAAGKFAVQSPNDNYWIEADSYDAALRAAGWTEADDQ